MTTRLELFNGATSGTITTTTAPDLSSVDIDTALGATAVHTASSPVEGAADALLGSGTLGYARLLENIVTAANRVWGDVIFSMSATTTSFIICRLYGGPLRGGIKIQNDQTVILRNVSATAATSTFTVPTDGTPVRIAYDFNFTATTFTADIYVGTSGTNNIYTGTPVETFSGTINSGNVATAQYGFTDSANTGESLRIIRVGLSDTAAIVAPTSPSTNATPTPAVVSAVADVPAPTPGIAATVLATAVSALTELGQMQGSVSVSATPSTVAATTELGLMQGSIALSVVPTTVAALTSLDQMQGSIALLVTPGVVQTVAAVNTPTITVGTGATATPALTAAVATVGAVSVSISSLDIGSWGFSL